MQSSLKVCSLGSSVREGFRVDKLRFHHSRRAPGRGSLKVPLWCFVMGVEYAFDNGVGIP